jgi:hypothetical protein
LPLLRQGSTRLQSLDAFRFYTRGNPLNLHNLLAILNPSSTVKTLIMDQDGLKSYVQVRVEDGKSRAQLEYLIPNQDSESLDPPLLEGAIKIAGAWGAQALLADLPSYSTCQSLFKSLGFIHWARQKVYRLEREKSKPRPLTFQWRTWTSADVPALEAVYRSLVPGLFQPIEQLTRKAKLGLILQDEKGKCLGFVDYDEGPTGIWLQPFLVPELNGADVICDMLSALHVFRMGPVYLSARSYQPWVDALAQSMGAELVSEQNLLVKYLAKPVLAEEALRNFRLEKGSVGSSFPL